MSQHSSTVRSAFARSADIFVDTLERIAPDQWEDREALGEWTVRELAGHTLRAFSTIETYLQAPLTADQPTADAVGYYRIVFAPADAHRFVADRGKQAGSELLEPVDQARTVVDRVLALVATIPDDRLVGNPAGVLRFGEYLKTRLLELTVHTLDLQRATGQPVDLDADAVEIVLAIAASLADPISLLSALSGRGELVGVNVFS